MEEQCGTEKQVIQTYWKSSSLILDLHSQTKDCSRPRVFLSLHGIVWDITVITLINYVFVNIISVCVCVGGCGCVLMRVCTHACSTHIHAVHTVVHIIEIIHCKKKLGEMVVISGADSDRHCTLSAPDITTISRVYAYIINEATSQWQNL